MESHFSRKKVVRYLEVLKKLRKAKQEKEMYEKEIYSNQISKLSRAAVFRDKI